LVPLPDGACPLRGAKTRRKIASESTITGCDGSSNEAKSATKKAYQKRENIKKSSKKCAKVSGFSQKLNESWVKVGGFWQFFAVFGQGRFQKWFGLAGDKILIRY